MHAFPLFVCLFFRAYSMLFQSSQFHLIVKGGSVKMSSFGSKFIVFVFGNKI